MPKKEGRGETDWARPQGNNTTTNNNNNDNDNNSQWKPKLTPFSETISNNNNNK